MLKSSFKQRISLFPHTVPLSKKTSQIINKACQQNTAMWPLGAAFHTRHSHTTNSLYTQRPCPFHFPSDLHFLCSFLIFQSLSSLNNYKSPVLTCHLAAQAVRPFAENMTAILSPWSSTSISVTGRSDCRPIPRSGPSTMGCNSWTLSTQEPQHPPNELSPSLITNYMRVNRNRLTRLARLLSKHNPLQIADYLPKIIIRDA